MRESPAPAGVGGEPHDPRVRVHRRTLQVEWGDCDAAGIVHFPRYFSWFDASTAAAFLAVDLSTHYLIEHYGIAGIPVRDVRASFSSPCTFEDQLFIESWIGEWGHASFKVRHRLFKLGKGPEQGVPAVESLEVRVWAARMPDSHRLKACPVPEEVKERFRL